MKNRALYILLFINLFMPVNRWMYLEKDRIGKKKKDEVIITDSGIGKWL